MAVNNKCKLIGFNISQEDHDFLKVYCVSHNTSITDLFRPVVHELIKKLKPQAVYVKKEDN